VKKHAFMIRNRWALGDTVCLSALVRDIHRAYPGKYELLTTRHFASYWENSPHCRVGTKDDRAQLVPVEYGEGIKTAGRGSKVHFVGWFHRDFERRTGLRVPLTEPKGDIHLSRAEKDHRLFPGRYWAVVAGGKTDATTKVWSASRFQRVVDVLAHHGVRCVQAGAEFRGHFHPTLRNCDNAVGKTNSIRHFFSLLYHAEGVICGVTAAMHIAAVFDKPCVVIAGGREEPWWESYTNAWHDQTFGKACKPVAVPHRFLHTIDLLDCCKGRGCWKDKVVALNQDDRNNPGRLCKRPSKDGQQPLPLCMDMISPDHVIEAVMGYYEDGTLPPIGKPTGKYSLPTLPAQPPPLFSGLPAPRAAEVPRSVEDSALDHPHVGGKFTAFVLGYGEHEKLLRRCLDSILANSPAHRLDLRVALNQPCPASERYVASLGDRVTKVYTDRGDRRKYPAMREMFWDASCPIETRYVLWFDDDSHVIDANWLNLLAREIADNHASGARMYGTKYLHDLMAYRTRGFAPEKWFRSAPWHRGRPFLAGDGQRESPNGSKILFATGGFWALATEAVRAADIPDARLNHNGGDITVGEQVRQAGFRIKDFCRKKTPVAWSDAKRRGFREDFPWSKVM
jgi:hypothetical protein